MFNPKEKAVVLGALFHDIGKFEQVCTGNPGNDTHADLGKNFVCLNRFKSKFERIIGSQSEFDLFVSIIQNHHSPTPDEQTKIIQDADLYSTGGRAKNEETEPYQDKGKNKFLCTPFNKIRLLSETEPDERFYKHTCLSPDLYDIIIPKLTENDVTGHGNSYTNPDFELFKDDLDLALDCYKEEADFESVINITLVVLEKYLWCVPDYSGDSVTSVSLFNHSKDVAALAHAIHLSDNTNPTKLNLIIGDIPGIQEYIFNVANRKPAKILRGRSIFVQLLTRNFATKFLEELALTEASLVMHAGGKFYIIAPAVSDFESSYSQAKKDIEDYLFENFRMDLSFICAYQPFDYKGEKDFGRIVELASHELLKNKHTLFEPRFFKEEYPERFVLKKEEYFRGDGSDTNSIKCAATDEPIRNGRERRFPDDETRWIDAQVKEELTIGSEIPKNNKEHNNAELRTKVLLNPRFNGDSFTGERYRNVRFLEVANHCSSNLDDRILDFNEIAENNIGAQFLTLIKGDIDNLGLIMAHGLSRDKTEQGSDETEASLSAVTTLSYHLKYYFSFFLNGFLRHWEEQGKKEAERNARLENSNIKEEELTKVKNENRIYTIFAGGDDLMLITPQSSVVKLLEEFNRKFNDFTCSNKEVHISFSVTHFKDHTPIRIVADLAEDNQKAGKGATRENQKYLLKDNKPESFHAEHDKSGTFIFDTFVKNAYLQEFNKRVDELVEWVENKKVISRGLIRKLLDASDMIKKYEETGDPSYLIWYVRLNYSINRLLKDKNGQYRNELVGNFFNVVLKLNKEECERQFQAALYSIICQVIYKIRN